MDESQRKIFVVFFVILAIMLGLFVVSYSLRGVKKKRVDSKTLTSVLKKPKPTIEPEAKPSSSPTSTPLKSSIIGQTSPFSETDLKEITMARTDAERLLRIANDSWLLDQVNNESLNERTREKYRLKTLDSYMDGMNAFENGDYQASIKLLIQSLKDPNATPVSRYLILLFLRSAATKIKNFELFLEFAKVQAELINKEDLSSLGIEKTDNAIAYCVELEELYKAATNESEYKKLVQKRMFADGGISFDIKSIENGLSKEIDEFKKDFGGGFSHD